MGCYFCYPNDKTDIKALEVDPTFLSFEAKTTQKISKRLYTVRETLQEASDCSELKNCIDVSS